MELVEGANLGMYNPSRIGNLQTAGVWVILYKESDQKSWPLQPRYWEVQILLTRTEAWENLQELIAGPISKFTRTSLGLYFRREQFGEGDYA